MTIKVIAMRAPRTDRALRGPKEIVTVVVVYGLTAAVLGACVIGGDSISWDEPFNNLS